MAPEATGTVRAIVVLGAALTPEGAATPALERRVRHGVRVLADHPEAHLLLTGGGRQPGIRPEADAMAEIARALGVDPTRIVCETESTRTLENAAYSAPLLDRLGAGPVVVVTDPFHMRRARWCFRRVGVEAASAPVPDARRAMGAPTFLMAWAREAVAFAWYRWRWRKGR